MTADGKFLGRIDGQGNPDTSAPRGAVLCARTLWAFSAAYRIVGEPEYLKQATAAKRELIDCFIDKEYGGVYWSLNPDGSPCDPKKQMYAIGFAIYGLSEYVRATGSDTEALRWASKLFADMETHCFDSEGNGYVEALSRDWSPIADMRLSTKDRNDSRTMNTHLHIIEPYTNLYRVLPSDKLKERIVNLLGIFTGRIVRWNGHLGLFFNDAWESQSDGVSFGHDIEASWLLWEAAEVVEPACSPDPTPLKDRLRPICLKIADAAYPFDDVRIPCSEALGLPENVVPLAVVLNHPCTCGHSDGLVCPTKQSRSQLRRQAGEVQGSPALYRICGRGSRGFCTPDNRILPQAYLRRRMENGQGHVHRRLHR